MTILFKTIHGSRLYGLDHEDSDHDWFTVVDGPYKTRHAVDKDSGLDVTVVSFNTFVREAQAGAPKALEAMFSQKAIVDEIAEFRAAFVAGTNYDAYKGIMKRIALTPKWDDEKHRRLVIRLGYSLAQLQTDRRFNPTLNSHEVISIKSLANIYNMEQSYDLALRLAGYRMSVLH